MSFKESDLPLAEPSEILEIWADAEQIVKKSYELATRGRLKKIGEVVLNFFSVDYVKDDADISHNETEEGVKDYVLEEPLEEPIVEHRNRQIAVKLLKKLGWAALRACEPMGRAYNAQCPPSPPGESYGPEIIW